MRSTEQQSYPKKVKCESFRRGCSYLTEKKIYDVVSCWSKDFVEIKGDNGEKVHILLQTEIEAHTKGYWEIVE